MTRVEYDQNAHNMTSAERLAYLTAELRKPFLVEYAYPTSGTAATFGMSRTGCYYVSRYTDGGPRIIASSHGYATRQEAQAVADVLAGNPYCVECGAGTELECICDELNHVAAQECSCGPHNTI